MSKRRLYIYAFGSHPTLHQYSVYESLCYWNLLSYSSDYDDYSEWTDYQKVFRNPSEFLSDYQSIWLSELECVALVEKDSEQIVTLHELITICAQHNEQGHLVIPRPDYLLAKVDGLKWSTAKPTEVTECQARKFRMTMATRESWSRCQEQTAQLPQSCDTTAATS
jgi:hypothetical protein